MTYRQTRREEGAGNAFKLRRGQLFGPYGVGSILPCPGGESLMISGLDAFPVSDMRPVRDSRLAKHLGVKRLLSPPEGGMVPASRFPRWLYCPVCKTMHKCKSNQPGAGKCQNPSCKAYGKQKLIPERFIVVCPEGHVDDLPIVEWVHGGPVSNPEGHLMRRITKGGTASLSDIEYQCVTCHKKKSLQGITSKGALVDIGYRCHGSRPWLWKQDSKGCSADPESVMVVQRGGTNVWYPDVFSSIYIPDGRDPRLIACVEDAYSELLQAEEEGGFGLLVNHIARDKKLDKEAIEMVFREMKAGEEPTGVTDGDFRQEEFYTLVNLTNQQEGVFEGFKIDPSEYSVAEINAALKAVTLVTTLRETRALVGFSRLLPDHNEGLSFYKRRKSLSLRNLDWTLGIQSTGEGIFLQFDKEALDQWLCNPSMLNRFALMQAHHDEHCRRHGKDREVLNPLYVLIHTLSHVLMLSLTKECGYSTASVRERIYCDKLISKDDQHEQMVGLLIYTASNDSEGSLGGLVRAGRPGRFERIFAGALDSARWCSSDPICIESLGQGPESCNLAACYSCALVPETSCEAGNKLLDRGLLVGTISDRSMGFFGSGEQFDSGDASGRSRKDDTNHPLTYKPDFTDGYCMTDEGFASSCERALEDAITESEKAFIRELVGLDEESALEVPYYSVPFESDDGSELDAALAWRESRVALFVGKDALDLAKEAGKTVVQSDGWLLCAAAEPLDPAAFASRIRSA